MRRTALLNGPGVLDRLRGTYGRLSDGRRRLALFLSDHWDEAAYLSAARLGQRVGVSESVVIRLANDLGYNGYPRLQASLRGVVRERLSMTQRLRSAPSGDPIAACAAQDIANIQWTAANTSPHGLAAAVRWIASARRVVCVGTHSSAVMASLLWLHLHEARPNVVLAQSGPDLSFAAMRDCTPQDVIVAISFPRFSRHTIDAVEYGKSKGARLIAITNSHVSPIAKLADVVLVAAVDSASFARSHVGTVFLINVLLQMISARRPRQIARRLRDVDRVYAGYGLLVDPAAPTLSGPPRRGRPPQRR